MGNDGKQYQDGISVGLRPEQYRWRAPPPTPSVYRHVLGHSANRTISAVVEIKSGESIPIKKDLTESQLLGYRYTAPNKPIDVITL